MRGVGGIILIALLLSPAAASSGPDIPSHNCIAPLKQRDFVTQAQLDRYKASVDLYRSCLESFVKEQEKAIEAHRKAAQSAIDDWNRFVGGEADKPPKAPENKKESDQESPTKP